MSGKARQGGRGRKNQAKQGEEKEKEKATQSVVSQANAGKFTPRCEMPPPQLRSSKRSFQRCLPVWDYFGVYCPELHKCRDTRSFYESV